MEITTETKTNSLNAYAQTHQNTNKTENNTPKTMEDLEKKYGNKFEDYLNEFNKLTADGELGRDDQSYLYCDNTKKTAFFDILDVKNVNGADIKDGVPVVESNYPPEIQDKLDSLYELEMDAAKAGDNKKLFDIISMEVEITKQYNQYMNGEKPTSFFQVDDNGKFFSELKSTNKKFDANEFVNEMLDVFTNELSKAKTKDLQEIYQRLVDGYKEMKEHIENPPYKETVIYG